MSIHPRILVRRAINMAKYILRGDINGLCRRIRSIWHTEINLPITTNHPKQWGILTLHHTIFVAHLLASRLRAHGWTVEITTYYPSDVHLPSEFPHDMYIAICPQWLKTLPPKEKLIVYQMEQSIASHWFTEEYINILKNSLAVLEYALVNIEFISGKNIAYPHVHYLPVGADPNYYDSNEPTQKKYDVLFYGDPTGSPRRHRMLNVLREHFDVKICREVFGQELIDAIKKSRVVVNLHYFSNDALLEMPRIQESLSLGVPVVSEITKDCKDYPELADAVIFFEQDNDLAMIDAIQEALNNRHWQEKIYNSTQKSAERFAFMFDRFLMAMGFLATDTKYDLPLPRDAAKIVLSMPETIERRRTFEINQLQGYAIFDGLRSCPGWIGCGLSYANLARHAIRHGISRLTVMEDDALLPTDFDEKMSIVHDYLDRRKGRWDLFVGLIARLHQDVRVLDVETFRGMYFVTIDKTISAVCNIYGEKALNLLASWNPKNRDLHTNTIDKHIENQTDLRIIVTIPFLVGHREEMHSTLWGVQNTSYNSLIADSEKSLQAKVHEFINNKDKRAASVYL